MVKYDVLLLYTNPYQDRASSTQGRQDWCFSINQKAIC